MKQRISLSDDAMVRVWYMATCYQCGTGSAQPFEAREPRDLWIKGHQEVSDHMIRLHTEIVITTD